jgi:xanthine dehydrogenase YagS FAD-binding subunit
MQLFTYERADSVQAALSELQSHPGAMLIAGGTELVNWMKEGIVRPTHLVDVNRMPLSTVEVGSSGLRMGALAQRACGSGTSRSRRNTCSNAAFQNCRTAELQDCRIAGL